MNREIHHIFPRPLAENKSFLGPNQTKRVLEHLKSLEYVCIDNTEPNKSFISSSKDVLSQLPEIKDIILNDFLQYIEYSMKITDAKFKIGSSWGTKAPPGTDSNWHIHSNYFYSGVYYPEKCTGIMFKDQLVDHHIHQILKCLIGEIFFANYLRNIARNFGGEIVIIMVACNTNMIDF